MTWEISTASSGGSSRSATGGSQRLGRSRDGEQRRSRPVDQHPPPSIRPRRGVAVPGDVQAAGRPRPRRRDQGIAGEGGGPRAGERVGDRRGTEATETSLAGTVLRNLPSANCGEASTRRAGPRLGAHLARQRPRDPHRPGPAPPPPMIRYVLASPSGHSHGRRAAANEVTEISTGRRAVAARGGRPSAAWMIAARTILVPGGSSPTAWSRRAIWPPAVPVDRDRSSSSPFFARLRRHPGDHRRARRPARAQPDDAQPEGRAAGRANRRAARRQVDLTEKLAPAIRTSSSRRARHTWATRRRPPRERCSDHLARHRLRLREDSRATPSPTGSSPARDPRPGHDRPHLTNAVRARSQIPVTARTIPSPTRGS